jgi:hypothetical protein
LSGPGPRLMKKRIYRAAVSQRFRNTGLEHSLPGRGTPELCNIIGLPGTFEFIMHVGLAILCTILWCENYEPVQQITLFEKISRMF